MNETGRGRRGAWLIHIVVVVIFAGPSIFHIHTRRVLKMTVGGAGAPEHVSFVTALRL